MSRDPARGVRDGARGARAAWSARRSWSPASELDVGHGAYDVQLMGGIELHLGKIAEMATGEGKTLVATLPLYLNALPGKGAHLVTVNSYLARRDSQWMGHLYSYLGLTVGCLDDTEPGTPERRAAYESRHHVRHEQRVRLRLPARQHGRRRSTSACSAAHIVRDRRRSGLGPHRRGADAAHHLGPGRQRDRREYASTTRPSSRLVRRQTELVERARRRRRAGARGGRHADGARCSSTRRSSARPKNKRLHEGAAGAGRQAARAEDGARAHRRPKLPPAQAAVPRHRGRPAVRARREGAHGPPHRSRRRVHVADGPRRVRAAGHLARKSTASSTITS